MADSFNVFWVILNFSLPNQSNDNCWIDSVQTKVSSSWLYWFLKRMLSNIEFLIAKSIKWQVLNCFLSKQRHLRRGYAYSWNVCWKVLHFLLPSQLNDNCWNDLVQTKASSSWLCWFLKRMLSNIEFLIAKSIVDLLSSIPLRTKYTINIY